MLLNPGVFGEEFHKVEGPFRLRCGQIRNAEIVHNGGWYNKYGQKIGWGDLNADDIRRIMAEIPEEETFIILSESDSYWNNVKFNSDKGPGWATIDRPTEMNPGKDFVASKARYIIKRNKLFMIDRYGTEGEAGMMHDRSHKRDHIPAVYTRDAKGIIG